MGEKSLDPQLWQACAGGMVNIPPVNTKVFYFPQGHAEHSQCHVDFPGGARIPSLILCRVTSLRFMADPDSDEVFAKIRLIPIPSGDLDLDLPDSETVAGDANKPSSFAKTLTQSDANNGGGFSVPRYCAETIFPRLDYAADPPVQNVVARDVHGGVWKFRHIYRGTPRRHLLTTGWSNFVNHKKLVAGDSIVFLRSESGEICVGIRRAKRTSAESGWTSTSCFGRDNSVNSAGGVVRVRPEAVIEAAARAAAGQQFEAVYYPRLSTPEFVVRASAVKAAMRVQWCPGMRFKMAFETEDSSRISWFMGTIGSVHVSDPIRWPHSPWRLLQVAWDEPDLLQNVKRVNPWLVESVSNVPAAILHHHHSNSNSTSIGLFHGVCSNNSYSPPRKKMRPTPFFLDNVTPTPSGIQGARHALFGISLSDLHNNNHYNQIHNHNHNHNQNQNQNRVQFSKPEALSCLLTIGNSAVQSHNSLSHGQKRGPGQFVLFGQPILTEQQITDAKSQGVGHCKVFMESEDVGRTLDLALLASYEDLHRRLAAMFGTDASEIQSHVLYHDSTGVLKRTGDEPFSDFVKSAKRLTIISDSSGNNVGGGNRITGMRNADNGLGASNKTGPLTIFA